MVTINEVAKYAGVSNATASRALRNIGKIRDETKQRVEQAAKDLGYVVNTTAQSLKMVSKNKVGLIVSDVNNEYYHYIQSSIKNILQENGFELTISFSSENPKDERKSFQMLIGAGVSFIIFTPTCNTNSNIIDIALKNDIKVFQLFRKIYDYLPSIINDDSNGAYMATKYLFSKSFKNILLFDVDYEFLDKNIVTPNRSLGFKQAIKEEKVNGTIRYLKINDYSKEDIYEEINKIQPDAIITANGEFGYIIYDYIHKNNKNIKLVTYDDNKWFELLKVSAIKQNLSALSLALIEFIKNNKNTETQNIVNSEELIIR